MTNEEREFLSTIAAYESPDDSTVEQLAQRIGVATSTPEGDVIHVGTRVFLVPPGAGLSRGTTADGKMGISFERITEANRASYATHAIPIEIE